jgi:hypothetical protein
LRTRTLLTLRALPVAGERPAVGELMAASDGGRVYRVAGVVTVRRAGDPRCRYRLTLELLEPASVPAGAAIRPWLGTKRAPCPSGASEAVRTARSTFPHPTPGPRPREARSRRILAAPVWSGADLGPPLRRKDVRDHQGGLLREADVEVDDDGVDPRYPSRRVRRAYRVDPLVHLLRAGTVGTREADAADELRASLELLEPTAGRLAGLGRGGLSPFDSAPIRDHHLSAARSVASAQAACGTRLWPAVLWVCLGGSVRGFAMQWRMRQMTASDLVASGMTRLADHLYGRAA